MDPAVKQKIVDQQATSPRPLGVANPPEQRHGPTPPSAGAASIDQNGGGSSSSSDSGSYEAEGMKVKKQKRETAPVPLGFLDPLPPKDEEGEGQPPPPEPQRRAPVLGDETATVTPSRSISKQFWKAGDFEENPNTDAAPFPKLEMVPRKEKTKTADKTCYWNQTMDDALVNAYLHQHRQGNRVSGTFTSRALDAIEAELVENFPDCGIDKEKIKNRNKLIKNKWSKCFDVFKNSTSGFAWNPTTNMWSAEPEVWKSFIEAKPEVAEWKEKPIHNYDKLLELYGRDRATGEYAGCAKEILEDSLTPLADNIEDSDNLMYRNEVSLEDIEMMYDNVDEFMRGTNQYQNTNSSSSSKRKRAAARDEEEYLLRGGLDNVAQAILKSTSQLIEIVKRIPITEEELYNHLVELGVEADKLVDTYMFLVDRPDKVRAIMGAPASVRKIMIERMMQT